MNGSKGELLCIQVWDPLTILASWTWCVIFFITNLTELKVQKLFINFLCIAINFVNIRYTFLCWLSRITWKFFNDSRKANVLSTVAKSQTGPPFFIFSMLVFRMLDVFFSPLADHCIHSIQCTYAFVALANKLTGGYLMAI